MIIFWSLFAIFFGNIEIISWRILNKSDLTENRRKFWQDIQETPFLPFIVIALVGMVIIQLGIKIIKDYQRQKEDQNAVEIDQKVPHITLHVFKKMLLLALLVILLVILVLLYYFIFTSLFMFLIKITGYSVSVIIGHLVKLISFMLVELALYGTYRVFDNWIRKPYVANEGKIEQTPV